MPNNLLKNWREWGLSTEPQLVKVFADGKNHQTALIKSAHQHYVLKVFQGSAETSINAQQWAAKLGLSPKIIYADNNLVIMPFVQAQHATQQQLPLLAQS